MLFDGAISPPAVRGDICKCPERPLAAGVYVFNEKDKETSHNVVFTSYQ